VDVSSAMPGVTDHGTQYQLRSLYEHKLQRAAFNFCWGPFGGVKGMIKSYELQLGVCSDSDVSYCVSLWQLVKT